MASEPPQSPLAGLEGRRFSFFPAIRRVEQNEWTLQDSTWSEIQVRNGGTGESFWIPRKYLGAASSTDAPVMILGLRRELEYKAGGIFPYRNVVTEMPSTRASRVPQEPAAPPPRQQFVTGADAKTLRLLSIAVGGALFVSLIVFSVFVGGLHNPFETLFRPDTSTADQRYLGLSTTDSYFEVVSRLGVPEAEDWISGEEDELQFQALRYTSRSYIVIMMGGTRGSMRYLGTVHEPSRQVLDSARIARGGDTSSMMRNLPEF